MQGTGCKVAFSAVKSLDGRRVSEKAYFKFRCSTIRTEFAQIRGSATSLRVLLMVIVLCLRVCWVVGMCSYVFQLDCYLQFFVCKP